MRLKLSASSVVALAIFAAFTVFITWRAKSLELSLHRRGEIPALTNKNAPDFALPSLDGRTVSLADFHGKKKLVVSFWASWCGPCRMEMPILREFYTKYHKESANFELLSISIDDERPPAETFATEMKLPFSVLLDLSSTAASAYGVEAIPTLFVIDEQGKVTYGHTGFDVTLEFQLAHQLGLSPDRKDTEGADGDSSH